MEALLARRPSQVGVGIEGDSNLPAARARVKELCRRSVIWLEVVAEMRACDNLLQADTPKLSSLEKEGVGRTQCGRPDALQEAQRGRGRS